MDYDAELRLLNQALRLIVEFVLDFANDFFEQVLECDDAFKTSVLVRNDREVKALLLHPSEYGVEAQILRDGSS